VRDAALFHQTCSRGAAIAGTTATHRLVVADSALAGMNNRKVTFILLVVRRLTIVSPLGVISLHDRLPVR
jgi:hypothetical protein